MISQQSPVINTQCHSGRSGGAYLTSHPDASGFHSLSSVFGVLCSLMNLRDSLCPLWQNLFLQNEPNFKKSIITLSDYSATVYCLLLTVDCRQYEPNFSAKHLPHKTIDYGPKIHNSSIVDCSLLTDDCKNPEPNIAQPPPMTKSSIQSQKRSFLQYCRQNPRFKAKNAEPNPA